jgi:PAS domain-containing protein
VDIERVTSVVRIALDQKMSFEKAVGLGLQAILVSPHFLFRVEREQPGIELDQYVLASRLSYFLWASIPDDQLLDLARDGRLSDNEVLKAQARRMLLDPKSEALVKRFFGQYLGLGNLQSVSPDGDRFQLWNDRLREAIRRETEMFCQEIITKDLPLDTLLRGDFTFVNPRLAELYGIDFEGVSPAELYRDGPGINRVRDGRRNGKYLHEDRWVRVAAPENRRGVLTHASILTLTSNPTVTSPVKRGKWILESILGDPPPPAPPNVPTFEETQKNNAKLSLREQLAIHRANPSCASCHDVMDPLGLGFENFDAVGQWRDKDGDNPIDAAGVLRDGKKFSGSVELVRLLAERQPEIYRYFSEKLLTYALGRGLEPYDNCAIDEVLESARDQGYSISSFIVGVVTSQPFTKRRPEVETAVSSGQQTRARVGK